MPSGSSSTMAGNGTANGSAPTSPSEANGGINNALNLNRQASHDHTAYVARARITRTAPPKPASNPLQFIQTKPFSLFKGAKEPVKRVEEVIKVKEVAKEEPEDWQSNLDNWKSCRRKRVEHIIDRVVEVKKLELEEHDRQRRKSKTFSEMMEERGSKGRKVSLAVYAEDDSNDLSDLGIGTSSASGKSSLSEDFDNQSVISDTPDTDKHHSHHLHQLHQHHHHHGDGGAFADIDNNSNPEHNDDELLNDDQQQQQHHHHHHHQHQHSLSATRDYISSPGYDTSTSSTAPASSPDPSSLSTASSSSPTPHSGSGSSNTTSYSGVATQRLAAAIATRPAAIKPFGLVNPQAGYHMTSTTTSAASSSSAISTSSSATSSLSKDSTPERSLESAVKPMPMLSAPPPPPPLAAPKRPPSTKIEDRLLSFEIMGASQQETERAIRTDLPKVDVLKRRELFERESPAHDGAERRRSSGALAALTGDLSKAASIKERLSHLEQRRDSEDAFKSASKPVVLPKVVSEPASEPSIELLVEPTDSAADRSADDIGGGEDSGIAVGDVSQASTETAERADVALVIQTPPAVVEQHFHSIVQPDVVPNMVAVASAAKPLPAARSEASLPPAVVPSTAASVVGNAAAADGDDDDDDNAPATTTDDQETETSVSSATLLSVVTSHPVKRSAELEVLSTTTTTISTTIVSITNADTDTLTNTTSSSQSTTTLLSTIHTVTGCVKAPLPPPPPPTALQSADLGGCYGKSEKSGYSRLPKPRVVSATKLPPLQVAKVAPIYENVTPLAAAKAEPAAAAPVIATVPAEGIPGKNAELLRGISAKLSAAATSALDSPYSSRLKRMTADLRSATKSVCESIEAKNERLKCQIVGVLEKNRSAPVGRSVDDTVDGGGGGGGAALTDVGASGCGSLSPTPSSASNSSSAAGSATSGSGSGGGGSRNIFDFIKANLLNETNQNLLEKSTFYVALNEHEARLTAQGAGVASVPLVPTPPLEKTDSTESSSGSSSAVDRLLDEELDKLN